jgi:hypothetical protein
VFKCVRYKKGLIGPVAAGSGSEKNVRPTRQTSTSRTNRIYLIVLIQQIDVLLVSSQTKKSRRCLVDIYLMSIIFWSHFDILKLKNKGQKDIV